MDEADKAFALRAAAHSATPATLSAPARFQGKVDDLAVARLLMVIERGGLVMRVSAGWTAPGRKVVTWTPLTAVATEALRTSLACETTVTAGPVRVRLLLPAVVHLRAARYPTRPACGESQALRHRILSGQYVEMVDCPDCLDVPLSGVSYSTYE